MTLAVTSSAIPMTQVEDMVETRVAQKISQVSGVGLVTLAGGQRPAVRVKLNAQCHRRPRPDQRNRAHRYHQRQR